MSFIYSHLEEQVFLLLYSLKLQYKYYENESWLPIVKNQVCANIFRKHS